MPNTLYLRENNMPAQWRTDDMGFKSGVEFLARRDGGFDVRVCVTNSSMGYILTPEEVQSLVEFLNEYVEFLNKKS